MEPGFWLQRWQQSDIGWHQDEINAHLSELWPHLRLPAGSTVFVPLCGKSRDMAWLAGIGHPVLGVEISDLAVAAFFEEHGVAPARQRRGFFEECSAGGVTILCGDFFRLKSGDLPPIAAVYDRASLIALPAVLRRRYVQKLSKLLTAGAHSLLITLEYPQEEMDGPPFSVGEGEIGELFDQSFRIDRLRTLDILEENPRFRQRGLSQLQEKVYLLRRL